jgi:hypothetical protein
MRLVSVFLLSILLLGCGTEGVDMEIEDVENWFKKNESEVISIIELFKSDNCLRRVRFNEIYQTKLRS